MGCTFKSYTSFVFVIGLYMLVAAHRGMHGGNRIQNAIPAFEDVLRYGMDALEADVAKAVDGGFFCFHAREGLPLLGVSQNFEAMTAVQVLDANLFNSIYYKIN